MLHYSIDIETKTVSIHGIINTNANPEKYWINK